MSRSSPWLPIHWKNCMYPTKDYFLGLCGFWTHFSPLKSPKKAWNRFWKRNWDEWRRNRNEDEWRRYRNWSWWNKQFRLVFQQKSNHWTLKCGSNIGSRAGNRTGMSSNYEINGAIEPHYYPNAQIMTLVRFLSNMRNETSRIIVYLLIFKGSPKCWKYKRVMRGQRNVVIQWFQFWMESKWVDYYVIIITSSFN